MSDKEVISAFEVWAQHPDRPHKLPIDKHPNRAYTDSRTYAAHRPARLFHVNLIDSTFSPSRNPKESHGL